MKKNTSLIWLIILIIIGVSIGLYFWQKNQPKEEIGLGDEIAIRLLIEEFGQKLKSVSLQAPQEIVAQSIEENYKDFVTSELLSLWQNDPSLAPGRITSSPWPERIEIDEIQKIDENNYLVKGRIIEITSVEAVEGGAAAEREVEITVEKVNGKWLISNLVLKPYSSKEEVGTTEYRNSALGIRFEYPKNFIPYLKDNEYLGDQPSRFVMGKDSAAPLNGNPYFVIMLSGVKGYYICPSLEDAKMSYSGSYEDIQKFIQVNLRQITRRLYLIRKKRQLVIRRRWVILKIFRLLESGRPLPFGCQKAQQQPSDKAEPGSIQAALSERTRKPACLPGAGWTVIYERA